MCLYFCINNTETIVKAVGIDKEQSSKEEAREQSHGHCSGATTVTKWKKRGKAKKKMYKEPVKSLFKMKAIKKEMRAQI